MLDSFNRSIYYLRISITDKCNLRCTYCMGEEGVSLLSHSRLLSFEQIARIVEAAAGLGFWKFRLTGGEPLVRRGVVTLVKMIRGIGGVGHLGMTTNGILLPEFASSLKQAGLDSLNISIDTLDPEKYHRITRWGKLSDAVAGVEAAVRAGFDRIKINMVVGDDTGADEVAEMEDFCRDRGLSLQRIRHYSLLAPKVDEPVYERPPRCGSCNRIRLTHDGFLKSCLHGEEEIPVDFSDITASIEKTIRGKPLQGYTCTNRDMQSIGG